MSAAPPGAIRRIVYLGTPGLAVPPLRALVDAGYEIPLVVSRADARRGRGAQRLPSPVKAAARALGPTWPWIEPRGAFSGACRGGDGSGR